MSVRSFQSLSIVNVILGSSGVQDADSLPSAQIWWNGIRTPVIVTVSRDSLGRYRYSWSNPLLAVGDHLDLERIATISTVADSRVIWSGDCDLSLDLQGRVEMARRQENKIDGLLRTLNQNDPNAQALAENPFNFGDDTMPQGVTTLFLDTATLNNGVFGLDASTQPLFPCIYNNSHANGDKFTFPAVTLVAGIYTCVLFGTSDTSRAKIDVALDGVVITTIDFYAASPSNVPKSFTLVVPNTGQHVLTLTANGKNASSSNYYMVLNRIEIRA